jgi:S-adenosyl-L-methionine hydrolase (adenosine-forming)
MTRFDTISFLSDFGHDDEFVGVVKSVIRELAPHTAVIDLTHSIPAFDVRAGSLALARAVQYVPKGVILAVVDPGVGTERKAVAVQVAGGDGIFVGPDNGLIASAVAMAGGAERAVALTNPVYQLPAPGPTFAGRDVFGPAAAHLCNGVDMAELGEEVDVHSLMPGVLPLTRQEGDRLVAEVLWVDRYGNAQLNVDPDEIEHLGDAVLLHIGEDVRAARRARTYGAIGRGQLGLVVDSYGLVSICLERQSAAEELGIAAGDEVQLEQGDDRPRMVSSPVTLRTVGQ